MSGATAVLVAALDELRAAAGLLRDADVALSQRPTVASNARWFMRIFVMPRRTPASSADDLFWTNLERARNHCEASEAALASLVAAHGTEPVVAGLLDELKDAGHATILPALQLPDVAVGEEAEASTALKPVVARMRICEARMVQAIKTLATQGRAAGATES
ncbi:MAG: hypothetical protein WCC60_04665 [Ilumatobacteraceae bacterium]